MFSDLAFIDWIALIFAAILLAAAAAAAIVAYLTAKNRPVKRSPTAIESHRPAHAASPPPPSAADIPRPAPGTTVVVDDVPEPPVLVPSSGRSTSSDIDVGDEPSTKERSVAARAARLRKRPVPDHGPGGRKRIVSAVEPKRMPAHAPNLGVLDARPASRLSIDMDRAEGFAARTPGFFDDPVGRHDLRYWDGHRWTEYVKEHGERFTDPL